MRVFVTGASGFVGSAVVKELLQAGHQVLGLARTDSAAGKIKNAGAEVHRGDINDLESLKEGAAQCDAVIHTAFNHDFSRYKDNCEDDRKVIMAMGSVLAGTGKPFVVTSGIGLMTADRLLTEDDVPPSSDVVARAASEEAANAVAAQGVKTYIVRLPATVHGEGDHGFVPMVIGMAREKGESAYVGKGENCWPAVQRFDAAVMYRMIVEQQPAQKVFHAVAEEGIAFRQIAEAIGQGLRLQTVSKEGKDAEAHFGWFLRFASLSAEASSEQSRKTLGWEPKGALLFEDMAATYFLKK